MADQKLCLKWNDFQDQAQATFKELRNDNDFTDVTLACEDQSIKAHKVILSACSPFFKKLLKTYSHPQPLIYMKGLKSNSLTAIIDFLYLGEANIFQEELECFLSLAEELQIKGLESRPEETVFDPMSSFNRSEDVAKSNQQTAQETKIWNGKFDFDANALKGTVMPYHQKLKQNSIISPDTMARIQTMIEKRAEGYNCTKCDYTTTVLGHMKEHVEKHIEGLQYPCNLCHKTFKTSNSFRQHKKAWCVNV